MSQYLRGVEPSTLLMGSYEHLWADRATFRYVDRSLPDKIQTLNNLNWKVEIRLKPRFEPTTSNSHNNQLNLSRTCPRRLRSLHDSHSRPLRSSSQSPFHFQPIQHKKPVLAVPKRPNLGYHGVYFTREEMRLSEVPQYPAVFLFLCF